MRCFVLRIMLSHFFLAADRMTGGYRHGFSNAMSSDWIWRISRKTLYHLNNVLRLDQAEHFEDIMDSSSEVMNWVSLMHYRSLIDERVPRF